MRLFATLILLSIRICVLRRFRYVQFPVGDLHKIAYLFNDSLPICCLTQSYLFSEPPVTITKLLDDVHTVVGERVEFEVEVSEEGANVIW